MCIDMFKFGSRTLDPEIEQTDNFNYLIQNGFCIGCGMCAGQEYYEKLDNQKTKEKAQRRVAVYIQEAAQISDTR